MSKKPKKSDGYEDISSYSKPPKKSKKKGSKNSEIVVSTPSRKTKEVVIAILCVMLCLVLVVSGVLAFFIRSKFNKLNYSDGVGGDPDATFIYEEENLNFNQISDIENAESVKELIKGWATNGGDKLYSKNVINVLLIGEDNEDNSSRSDSTILVTINKKTKKIILTSFLRDSYTYMNIEGQDRYDKTNHSYSWGGAAKLMEVISDNYKIKIDHFVTINYQSFIKAVDELGGINVMVTDAEAKYMNRTTKMKGFESGPSVNLDGQHALVFARIRKLDGEPERTERQRRLITAFIDSIRDSSLTDINNAIDKFLPYVTTNYKESEILSLATKAVTEGWLGFEVVSQVAPSEETRMGFTGYRTYTGYLDVWIVDYVKAAREIQLSLYGQTNITIDENNHVSAIDLALGTNRTESDNYYEEEEDEDEETTDRWQGFISDYTIPTIEFPSYSIGIGDIFNPNGGREDETEYSDEEETNDYEGSEEETTEYDEQNSEEDVTQEDYQ